MILDDEKVAQLSELHAINLERDIINILAERLKLPPQKAMELFYNSEIANLIANNTYGICYLSPQYLAEELLSTHPA
jgi:hypothetical protein